MSDKAIEKSAFILANDIQTFYDLEIGSVPDIEKMITTEFSRFRIPDEIAWPEKSLDMEPYTGGWNDAITACKAAVEKAKEPS